MIDPLKPEDAVEVTQADRDAASRTVRYYRSELNGKWADRIVRGECDDGEMVQSFARHRLAASTIPPGWQLVPVEPTQKMLHRGASETSGAAYYSDDGSMGAQDVWSAMLAAAPVPPAGQSG